MLVKVKADRILAYLLIIMLLFGMTTAMLGAGVSPAMPSAGRTGSGASGNSTIHGGFDAAASAEIFAAYPCLEPGPEFRSLKTLGAVQAVAAVADAHCPLNSFFVLSEEICLKLIPGIVAGFLHDKDGMK